MLSVESCNVVSSGLASQHTGRLHSGIEGHLDVGLQPVTDHNAVCRVNVEAGQGFGKHHRRRLAQADLALLSRACLDSCGYGSAVGLATAAREGAEPIWVGLDEECPLMEPDGVEGDLKLAVVEGAVIRSDDDVYLLGVLTQLDPGLT